MPPEEPRLPTAPLSRSATLREFAKQAFGDLPESAGDGVVKHIKQRAAEAVDPRCQFLNMDSILKRDMSIHGGFVQARTKGKNQWRNVDIWDRAETHPKNSPRRELALLADVEEPMYGEDYTTGQFYEMLLDWASDTDKCDFLKDIRTRFLQLKNADSRNPNDELEALAR